MHSDEQRIADAWLIASADLGIEVTTPFTLRAPTGESFECIALIHSFGLPAGTVITNLEDDFDEVFTAAGERGYHASSLNPFHYSDYDRASFIETVKSWEWTGSPDAAPAWYRTA
jgi:hypothetical protein